MREKDVKLEVFFDKQLNLYCAAYRDNNGQIVGDSEYAPSKALALKWLSEFGPDIVTLFPKKKQNQE